MVTIFHLWDDMWFACLRDPSLEGLRVDRQLEEALVQGPDPLHLAEVFGLHETTAMRYAASARARVCTLNGGTPETGSVVDD